MLSPDTILQNRYRVVRQLGQGGMSTVYEAIDERVSAVVVLKEANIATDDSSRREFESEARLLANLQHQALPKVMDYFTEGDVDYLVMEYIPGYDLLELLRRRGAPFHVDLVLHLADELLDVLVYLHGSKPPILHRDIKPANLKLTQREEVYLLDFGLAKGIAGKMEALLTNRSVQGYTPFYASLEQILGQGTDHRSDLYSFGATLYHLLANMPPIDAPTRDEQIGDGRPDPLIPVHHLNPKVPAGISAIIQQVMALRRKDRPQSAAEIRRALSNAREASKRAGAEAEQRRAIEQKPHADEDPAKFVPTRVMPERANAQPQKTQQQPPASPPAPARQELAPDQPKVMKGGHAVWQQAARFNAPTPAPYQPSSQRKKRIVLIASALFAIVILAVAITLMLRNGKSDSNSVNVNLDSPQPLPQQSPQPSPTQSPAISNANQEIRENLNGVPLDMVLVPAGTFTMGSPDSEKERMDSEGPQHLVTLQSFYIGKYEVTQAQYRAVMGSNPSKFKGDNLPVEEVAFDDAVEFCRRLSQMTGREYRLPSESEWEYACRAGTTTPFAFGSSLSSNQANFDGTKPYGQGAKGVSRKQTTPVGSFSPNGFGIYDMHGNVWEWCEDWYHDDYNEAPVDGSAWENDEARQYRVMRGGSWFNDAGFCRSAIRRGGDPNSRESFDLQGNGFRVVMTARP